MKRFFENVDALRIKAQFRPRRRPNRYSGALAQATEVANHGFHTFSAQEPCGIPPPTKPQVINESRNVRNTTDSRFAPGTGIVSFSERSYETSATIPIPSQPRFAGYAVCSARVLLLLCAPYWKGSSIGRSRAAARPRRGLFCFNFNCRRSSRCKRCAGFEPYVSGRTQRSGRADRFGFTCGL